MDLQKKSFIEPCESCPHWLKITLWKELGRLVKKYRITILKHFTQYAAKHFFEFYFRYESSWSQTPWLIIESKIENPRLQECFLRKILLEVSYFARNTYETETVTSGLCYLEDSIFLEHNIVWFWNSLDVQSTDSLVELYNILSYSRFLS